ncbi:MAG: zinc ribbon domain-containing protein [Dysgonamonadaceae bacterium]|jgi:predicted nucleic acid-binding Zn ribbon protein|nr:zinc ribbon domain-containing protein [Dysgonamonadaceae bacterium]
MGLLDGLVKGLADIIPDQGNPELKAYKAQNELKDLSEKENLIFAKLGRQLYADGGADRYPEIRTELDALANARRAVEERIKAASDEVEAKKKAAQEEEARRCPGCGATNHEGAGFCSECGTKLSAPKRFCTNCGAEVPAGSRFCNECGQKMEE